MAVTMPRIDITFKQLAGSLIQRSERGIAVLLIKDDTGTEPYITYTDATQAEDDRDTYTENSLRYIKDILQYQVNKCVVVRVGVKECHDLKCAGG